MRAPELLPEYGEDTDDATVLRQYQRLRELLGVGTVNLVHRHLATVPGALDAVVDAARSVRAGGWLELGHEALEDLPPRPPVASSRGRPGSNNLAAAEAVLATYSDANPRNYVVIRSLVAGLPEGSRTAPRPTHLAHLPPAPSPGSLAPDLLERGLEVAAGLGLDSRLLPTLHRHLGVHEETYSVLLDVLDSWGGSSYLRVRAERFAGEVARRWGRAEPVSVDPALRAQVAEVWRMFKPAIASHSVLSHLWLGVVRELRRPS